MRFETCKNCKIRNTLCHKNCESYLNYKNKLEKIKQKKIEEKRSYPARRWY